MAEGTRVEAGDVLVILESMKMEILLTAPVAGVVKEVRAQPGSPVRAGQRVVVIEEGVRPLGTRSNRRVDRAYRSTHRPSGPATNIAVEKASPFSPYEGHEMTTTFDLRLATLSAAYTAGDITPRQLILGLRDKAAALNGEFNAFIHLLSAEELEPHRHAGEQDARRAAALRRALRHQDNIDLAGVPTTAARPAYAYTPETSATVVDQLLALGAVPLGKTNLDQFATGLNGTRSPYGECRNSVHPDYPSGGSSAGSSLAVALGLCSFALGTDTAGSGRVPAALNNPGGPESQQGADLHLRRCPGLPYAGLRDLLHRDSGRSQSAAGAHRQLDPRDEYSRSNPLWNDGSAFGQIKTFRFGIPQHLEFLGCAESPALFAATIEHLKALGGEPVEIDFEPFLEAARLLYEGPWVAERYSVAGALIEQQPDAVLPVIKAVLEKLPAPPPCSCSVRNTACSNSRPSAAARWPRSIVC